MRATTKKIRLTLQQAFSAEFPVDVSVGGVVRRSVDGDWDVAMDEDEFKADEGDEDGIATYFSNVILAKGFEASALITVSLFWSMIVMKSCGMVAMLAEVNCCPLSVPASHVSKSISLLSFHLPSLPQRSRLSTPTNQSGDGAIMLIKETMEYWSLTMISMFLISPWEYSGPLAL